MEALSNDIKLRRDALGDVNTNEDYLKWHDGNHVGRTGAYFKSIGVSPSRESIIAQLNQPGGLEKLKQASALGSTKLQQNLMDESRALKVANIGATAPMMNARLNQRQYEDKLAAGGDIITSLVKDPETGQDVEMQFRRNLRTGDFEPVVLQPPSMRVKIAPSSATSSFTPSGAGGGATNVNALAPQGGAAAAPNVNALTQAPTFGRPKVPFTAPVPVLDENNRPVFVSGREAIGKTPATPEALKIIEKEKISKEGKESVSGVLNTLYSEYGNLVKSGGITDTRKSTEENIAARTGASGVGQLTGSFTGSEAQSFRDAIEQTRPLLLTAIMKATGLSATQLNSNVELQTYLKTATDPKVSIQSNVKALNNISTMFGVGEKFEVPEIKTPKEAKAADTPPAGLSPDIAALWKYMPPEDRKLWQK
jgi:hypothetical protein